MQNRRQIIASAGALAPSLILPAGILTTSNAHAIPQLLVEKLRVQYPAEIKHVRHFPKADGIGKLISGKDAIMPNGNRILKEEWTLTRTSGPIWPTSKFIDYSVEFALTFDSGTTIRRVYNTVRNRLNSIDRADMFTEVLKKDGSPNYFTRPTGAGISVPMNTYAMAGRRAEGKTCSSRCLLDNWKARMFALSVPFLCTDIPDQFAVKAGTFTIASSGLLSWYFGYKEFDGINKRTGKDSRFAMWYAWDAIQWVWRWTIIDTSAGAPQTMHSTLIAAAGSGFGSIARLMTFAAVSGTVFYGTLIARAAQTAGALINDTGDFDPDDAWATGLIALTLASAGIGGSLLMHEMRHVREKMGTAAGRIKAAGNSYLNIHEMSGVVSAVGGNYLQRGAQSAQDDWEAPIEYSRPDIDALDALMNSLRGWPN